MPIWPFYCPTCNIITDRLFSTYTASINATCTVCGTNLERQFTTGAFVVTGYNAKNLYSKKN